jgi:hypothetical protein
MRRKPNHFQRRQETRARALAGANERAAAQPRKRMSLEELERHRALDNEPELLRSRDGDIHAEIAAYDREIENEVLDDAYDDGPAHLDEYDNEA